MKSEYNTKNFKYKILSNIKLGNRLNTIQLGN